MSVSPRSIPLLALALLAGCGPSGDNTKIPVYPTKGRIVLADGNPARGASVMFIGKGAAGGPNGIGVLDPDGRFSLKSMGDRDGMQPGTYKVVVNPSAASKGVSADDKAFGMSNIPQKFWSDESTTLEAKVEAKDNDLQLRLE